MFNIWLAFRKNEVYTPQNFRYIQKSIISILSYKNNIRPYLNQAGMDIECIRELTTIFILLELEQRRLDGMTLDTMSVSVEIRFYSLIIGIMSMFVYCLSSLKRGGKRLANNKLDIIHKYVPNNISACMLTVVYKLIEQLRSHDLFYNQYLGFDWTRYSLMPFMEQLDAYIGSSGRSDIPIQPFFAVVVYVMPPQPLMGMMESTGAFRGEKQGKQHGKQGKQHWKQGKQQGKQQFTR